jgi:hydrogenase maturation protein HypF
MADSHDDNRAVDGPPPSGVDAGTTDTSPEPDTAAELRVTGTVQGVGFRPFVARTAAEFGLAGSVQNTDGGVRVVFEGPEAAVEAAVDRVRTDPPPLARIDSATSRERDPQGHDTFEIVTSTTGGDRTTLVPPDTGICPDCLDDVRNSDSRYHDYWATACVDCGPRFAVTRTLPYDRARTAMADFSLCADCRDAYEDRLARRYHAQTVACPDCGPTVRLLDADGGELATGAAAIRGLADRLQSGAVAGIKGTGGTHLSCLATRPQTVARLRERTGRPEKPFAVMAPSRERVASFARVSDHERASLTDARRPIVVLDRERDVDWLDAVAPGLHTVGVMLPYSGLHHLLFDSLSDPLVATSANRPGEPMCTTGAGLLDLDAVDYVLTHDREVVNRCDDSVVRHVDGDRRFLRRSRGWVPEPLARPVVPDAEVLGVGGRSDVTVALTDGDRVVPSQHVGDVADPATARFHREAADHLADLLGSEPDVIAHDLHPGFKTTEFAAAADLRTEGVWHHHAHAASLLAEHDRERAIVVAADGTGRGPDGVVRGGEILDSRLAESERVGGLSEFRLPGGDRAVEQPTRILADVLSDAERAEALLVEHGVVDDHAAAGVVRRQAAQGVNSPVTTSAGRFLDAASALLGICPERAYQGQPAMRLEAAAARGSPLAVDPPIDWGGEPTLRVGRALDRLAARADAAGTADLAATAQTTLADGLARIAVEAADRREVDAVGFTGGVAYNPAISARLRTTVEDAGLTFLGHAAVPPGDAGLSYGQAVAVSSRLRRD